MKTDLEIKWEPILDILEIKDESKKSIFAEYAEGHMKIEMQDMIAAPNSNKRATLPTSLKILTSLNLENKSLILDETILTPIEFHYHIGEFYDLPFLEAEEAIVHGIMDTLIKYINKELETKDTLHIGKRLISSINVLEEDKNSQKVIFNVHFKIE